MLEMIGHFLALEQDIHGHDGRSSIEGPEVNGRELRHIGNHQGNIGLLVGRNKGVQCPGKLAGHAIQYSIRELGVPDDQGRLGGLVRRRVGQQTGKIESRLGGVNGFALGYCIVVSFNTPASSGGGSGART